MSPEPVSAAQIMQIALKQVQRSPAIGEQSRNGHPTTVITKALPSAPAEMAYGQQTTIINNHRKERKTHPLVDTTQGRDTEKESAHMR